MNRYSFFLALILHSAFFIDSSAQKFNAGILGGFVASQVDGDHLSGYDKPGVKAGGYVNRKIGDKMNMQFELEFVQKGSRRPLDQNTNVYYLLRLNYVEAPLMLSYNITAKWNLEAGASLAVLISSYEEDESGIAYGTDNEPSFHSYDYLFNAGANYALSDRFTANIRYSYSFSPIRGPAIGYTSYYLSAAQYNNLIAFSILYQI